MHCPFFSKGSIADYMYLVARSRNGIVWFDIKFVHQILEPNALTHFCKTEALNGHWAVGVFQPYPYGLAYG